MHDTGTDAINRHFHAVLLKRSGLDAPAEFLPAEPVMMRRNDYGRDLFNGDQGIVLRVADENGAQHFMAVFPRGSGFAAYHLGPLRASLMHAFAVTVHKSQGSEHDHVAIILPDRLIPIVTREILYTAVTRSRRSATIIGSRELLTEGAGRGILRFSGIAEAQLHRLGSRHVPGSVHSLLEGRIEVTEYLS